MDTAWPRVPRAQKTAAWLWRPTPGDWVGENLIGVFDDVLGGNWWVEKLMGICWGGGGGGGGLRYNMFLLWISKLLNSGLLGVCDNFGEGGKCMCDACLRGH